jgi:hypothetical protein
MKRVKKYTLLMLLATGLLAEVCAAPGEDDSQKKEDSQEEGSAQIVEIDTTNHGNGQRSAFEEEDSQEEGSAQIVQIDTCIQPNLNNPIKTKDTTQLIMQFLPVEGWLKFGVLNKAWRLKQPLYEVSPHITFTTIQTPEAFTTIQTPEELTEESSLVKAFWDNFFKNMGFTTIQTPKELKLRSMKAFWDKIFNNISIRNENKLNPLLSITIPGTHTKQMLQQCESFHARCKGLNLVVPVKLIMAIDRLCFTQVQTGHIINENIRDYPFIAKALKLDVNTLPPGRHSMALVRYLLVNSANLRVLDVSDNYFGVAGAKALAPALAQLTHLRELNVLGNKIGDAGATALVPVLEIGRAHV